MKEVITIGIDLAKSVFQIHGVDAAGSVVIRRQLRRRQMLPFFTRQPPCLVGIEACATSHHWARQLALLGHQVKLMPPRYVKPYVKRNKNDMADAEAICEAVTRPTMRFVTIKTEEQQSVLMVHKTRQLFVRQRTMLINALRAHLAEYGLLPVLAVMDWRLCSMSSRIETMIACRQRRKTACSRCGHNWHWSNNIYWKATAVFLTATVRARSVCALKISRGWGR